VKELDENDRSSVALSECGCSEACSDSPDAEPISLDDADRLARMAAALADPIRVRIVAILASGRTCCALPETAPGSDPANEGVCICELTSILDMGQSKLSYHMAKLKEVELVREDRRGKWNYYSLDGSQVKKYLDQIRGLCGQGPSGC